MQEKELVDLHLYLLHVNVQKYYNLYVELITKPMEIHVKQDAKVFKLLNKVNV